MAKIEKIGPENEGKSKNRFKKNFKKINKNREKKIVKKISKNRGKKIVKKMK